MRAAMDAVKAGSLGNVLVCSSDLRLGMPNGGKSWSLVTALQLCW